MQQWTLLQRDPHECTSSRQHTHLPPRAIAPRHGRIPSTCLTDCILSRMPPRSRAKPARPCGPRLPVRAADAPLRVRQTLRSRAKHENIRLNYGSLYKVVESLQRRGLIRERETVRESRRPEKAIYEITDDGSREFVEWLSDLIAAPAREYLQFGAALSLLPGLPPGEVIRLVKDIETGQLEGLGSGEAGTPATTRRRRTHDADHRSAGSVPSLRQDHRVGRCRPRRRGRPGPSGAGAQRRWQDDVRAGGVPCCGSHGPCSSSWSAPSRARCSC